MRRFQWNPRCRIFLNRELCSGCLIWLCGFTIGQNGLLDRKQSADLPQGFEFTIFCEESFGIRQSGDYLRIVEIFFRFAQCCFEHFASGWCVCRVHQHDLDDEIKLTQWRRYVLRVHYMGLEKESDVVQEF